MTSRAAIAGSCLLGGLLFVFARSAACSPATPTQAAPEANGGGSGDAGADGRPSADANAPQIALAWLGALRRRDKAALTKHSRLPFVLRDTGTEGDCTNLDITTPAKLDALKCLLDDHLLHEDLEDHPRLDADVLSPKHLPNWARKWKKDVAAGLTPVGVLVMGNGDSVDLVLLVGDDGVHGIFKQVEFERN